MILISIRRNNLSIIPLSLPLFFLQLQAITKPSHALTCKVYHNSPTPQNIISIFLSLNHDSSIPDMDPDLLSSKSFNGPCNRTRWWPKPESNSIVNTPTKPRVHTSSSLILDPTRPKSRPGNPFPLIATLLSSLRKSIKFPGWGSNLDLTVFPVIISCPFILLSRHDLFNATRNNQSFSRYIFEKLVLAATGILDPLFSRLTRKIENWCGEIPILSLIINCKPLKFKVGKTTKSYKKESGQWIDAWRPSNFILLNDGLWSRVIVLSGVIISIDL